MHSPLCRSLRQFRPRSRDHGGQTHEVCLRQEAAQYLNKILKEGNVAIEEEQRSRPRQSTSPGVADFPVERDDILVQKERWGKAMSTNLRSPNDQRTH